MTSMAEPIGEYERLAARQAYVARFRRAPRRITYKPPPPVVRHAAFAAFIDALLAELARREPPPLIERQPRPATHRAILAAVAEAWGVTKYDLCSPSRRWLYTRPRFAAMRLLYDPENGRSTTVVGKILGGRDHSTVVAGLRRAAKLLASNADFADRYHAALAALDGAK